MDASLRRWYDIQTDNVPDEVPVPVGYYRFVWAGGENPRYTKGPYYDRREVGLVATKQVVTQVLVGSLREMVWINVDPSDLSPLRRHPV